MHVGSILRALRAGVFAAVCVLLASVGHALMSGDPVPGWILPFAWLGAALLAWFLADRERGPILVGALTVGTQAVLHCVFSLGHVMGGQRGGAGGPLAQQRFDSGGSGHPGTTSHHHTSSHSMHGGGMAHHAHSADMGAMTHAHAADMAHVHHAGAAMPDPSASMGGMVHGGMPGGMSGMVAAHLLVALLSAWWLWGGERAVFRAVRAASVRLFAPLAFVLDVALPVPAPAVFAGWRDRPRAPRKLFLSHVIWLRGPPLGRAV